MSSKLALIFGAAACVSTASAATFNGNGATGFGGPVGTGSLEINDSLTDMSFTLNRGTGTHNDVLVVYLDTQPDGFANTSLFTDSADGGRTAVSGATATSRTTVNFAGGFGADYALSIENGFIGVFGLAENGSHTFLFGEGQSGGNSAPSYTLNLTSAQMNQIGITAGSGETFSFVGTLISPTAYRSDESIGASTAIGADGGPNPGSNNPLTFTESLTFTTVPEPGTITLGVLGAVAAVIYGRRRRS
jgi:hypothetical protein